MTKGAGSKKAALAMAYKLLDTAQERWRRFNGHELPQHLTIAPVTSLTKDHRVYRAFVWPGQHVELALDALGLRRLVSPPPLSSAGFCASRPA